MEVNKYGNLCLDKEIKTFVILQLSIGHHNKCYDYENNNNKSRQKPKKISRKVK